MNQDSIKVIIGTGGIATQELIGQITPDVINSSMGLITQIIVAIATIISLFRKKKNV